MDVFTKRKMLIELSDPNVSQETRDKWAARLAFEAPTEGEVEKIVKAETEGSKIEAEFRGEKVTYWTPQNTVWISGKGITVDRAYRVVSEDDETMEVRQVYGDQIQAIKQAYIAKARAIVDENKRKREAESQE